MNGFENFGQRIYTLRKARGMTQEDLAGRLGISAQAVSKWENEASYPDITLLPTIAAILEVDVNRLFGVQAAQTASAVLPSQLDGLALAHQYGEVGCYSNKPVLKRDGSGVKFEDGSTAELSSRLVINRGEGEIRTYAMEQVAGIYTPGDAEYVFGHTDSLRVVVWNNDTEVVRSPDERTRVIAKGSGEFIHLLKAEVEGETLTIHFGETNGQTSNGSRQNEVRIEVPYDRGRNLKVEVTGSGDFKCAFPFESGKIAVNGSGDVELSDFEVLVANVNGSGDIRAGNAREATLSVNGSGDITAADLGHLKVSLNGSADISAERCSALTTTVNGSGNLCIGTIAGGDVSVRAAGSCRLSLKKGDCDRFDVHLNGSGMIDAQGVAAQSANIVLDQYGEVILGRVIKESTEQVKKKGKIRILARGPADTGR